MYRGFVGSGGILNNLRVMVRGRGIGRVGWGLEMVKYLLSVCG